MIRTRFRRTSDSVSAHYSDHAAQLDPPRASKRVAIVALLLAALLHALALKGPWANFLTLTQPTSPPRVEIQQVDPSKLQAIRKQWRESEKSLLLQKDKSPPKDSAAAPPDARYLSDRNIRVEKEQRARNTDVLPRPQGGAPEKAKPRTALPSLGNLGVPFRLKTPTPATPSADQAILDDSLPEGSQNLLNAQESVYYSFFARMYETIGPMWRSRVSNVTSRPRLDAGDYTTQVDVIMDAQGNVLDVKLLRSSGIAELDQVVSSAWHAAKKFPNPPQGLLGSDGRVHTGWTFTVRMTPGFGLNFAPPERNS